MLAASGTGASGSSSVLRKSQRKAPRQQSWTSLRHARAEGIQRRRFEADIEAEPAIQTLTIFTRARSISPRPSFAAAAVASISSGFWSKSVVA